MKRLFALLLTVSMILGMIVVPAAAETVITQDPEVCPHCGTAWNDCNWSAWVVEDPETSVPSGHYYLDNDLNMTARYKLGTSDGQSQDLAVDICLDLRGYTMTQTTANTRAFYVYDYSRFAIMDTVGGGKIIGTGRTNTGGTIYTCANATVDLYSGTLLNSQKNRTKDAAVIYIAKNGNFNMYGGIIDGTDVTKEIIKEDKENNVSGQYPRGTAFTTSGTVHIYDGMILGGQAYQGGTIAVNSTGALYVHGGTVMNGLTQSNGGCIYSQGFLEITGGTITGGYAKDGKGGNIYSSGTNAALYVKGGVIENGQSSSGGGNVSANSGIFEVSGGIIRGNAYANTAVTISGDSVIDLCGYEGLQVVSGKVATIRDLSDDAKVVLRGEGAMTVAADSPDVATYLEKGLLIPASRYHLEVVDGVLTGSQDDTGYCPHCQQDITWIPYTADTNTSGHYYIPSGGVALPAGSAGLTIAKGVEIVLNLAHGSAKPATPYQVAGSLSVLSTAGSVGSVYTTAATTDADGAVFYVTGTLNLYDGILGRANNTAIITTGKGGVAYLNGGTMNMYGGWVMGVTAANAGAIFINGSKGTLNLENGVICNGVATASGGNIYMDGKSTMNMNGGMVLGGTGGNAGNIYNYSGGKLNINGGIIANGTATDTGGNLRHAATNCVTTITNGIIYGGEAPSGGNCYPNNGKFIMTGGSLINGVATTGHSGNLYARAGYHYISNNEDPREKNYIYIGDTNPEDDIPTPQILGGKAATEGGNISISGSLTLGKCVISGGKSKTGGNLYLDSKAYLTIEPGFDQELIMTANTSRLTQLDTDRAFTNTFCTQMNGKLYVENYDMALLVKSETGSLGLAGASLVNVQDDTQAWFATAQEAANAYESGKVLRLFAPNNEMVMDGTVIMDLNGTNLNVSGNGTLYGFDSSNDDYDGYGTVTANGVEVAASCQAPNGYRYVTVEDANTYSFHRLGMAVTNVSLRSAEAGVYYKAVWECDTMLQPLVEQFGLAISTEDLPGSDFATDADTLYTTFQASQFVSGQPMTSAMIKNIVKEGEDNTQRAQTQIFATAYAILTDGTVVVGDDLSPSGVCYSFYDVMGNVNRYWPKCTDRQQAGVKELYALDAQAMSTWNLYNITAAINGTPAVRPLKILTLGHSLALDACHMINLVSAAEGYDQEFIIGTLYYSGCPLYKHVNYLRNDLPEYSLHISSTLSPDTPPNKMPNYTMKMAVQYDDWDIIVMQGGVFEIAYDNKYQDGNIQIIQDYVNQHKTNPNAIFAWHMAWAPPTTNSLRDKYPYEPNSYYNSYEAFNHNRDTFYQALTGAVERNIVSDDSFVYLIPSGTAFENALSSYLEETDLHRDYVHASDLSRVMVSYLWYCVLAGVEELDSIQLDAIPKAFLKSTSDKSKDRVLTDAEKAVILEAVNNALKTPLQRTQSQYTTKP